MNHSVFVVNEKGLEFNKAIEFFESMLENEGYIFYNEMNNINRIIFKRDEIILGGMKLFKELKELNERSELIKNTLLANFDTISDYNKIIDELKFEKAFSKVIDDNYKSQVNWDKFKEDSEKFIRDYPKMNLNQ